MTMVRSDTADSFLPEDFGALLDLEVQSKAIAAQVSTKFGTERQSVGFPLWVADPDVAFYNELDDITLSDGDTDEVVVTPSKTAGLTLLSNELADDSDPAIAQQVAAGLANKIAKALDSAYFAATTVKGPNGLLSLSYTAVVDTSPPDNLDPFVSARFAAEAHGAKLTHWVMHPDIAEALTKVKTLTSGSNQPLLTFVEDGITIVGLPVLTSTDVDSSTVAWGIDATQQRYVLRKGTTVEKFPSVVNDGQYVRGISRVGFGFLNPEGVIRITAGPLSYTLTVTGGSSGSDHYSLRIDNGETAAIAYNANAAAIKSAIVAVDDGITAADVTVTGSGPFAITLAYGHWLVKGTDAGATTTTVVGV